MIVYFGYSLHGAGAIFKHSALLEASVVYTFNCRGRLETYSQVATRSDNFHNPIQTAGSPALQAWRHSLLGFNDVLQHNLLPSIHHYSNR